MKIIQVFKNNRDYWPRISLMLSIGFIMLSVFLLILGNRLLEDARERVLEQRRVIAQVIANQIDRSLLVAVSELEQTLRLANFDPSKPDKVEEIRAMAKESTHPRLLITDIIFMDPSGSVVLAEPPDRYTPGTDLSGQHHIAEALSSRDMYISTPYYEPEIDNLFTAITIPVLDGDRLLGWLTGVVDLDEYAIKTLLEDAVSLDHTAHGVLTDREGRALVSTFDLPFLSLGEHHTYYRRAIARGQPDVEEVPFELELPGEPKGHHHIMAFAPLKTVQWGVFIGGDVVEETFAGPYRLFILLASFFVLSVVGTWGAALVSTKRLLEPVRNTYLKFDMSRQIANAKDWEELTSLIVRIPATFAPFTATRLLLRDRDSKIELVSEWCSDGNAPLLPKPPLQLEVCENCVLAMNNTIHSLSECDHQSEPPMPSQARSFCLPLLHLDLLVGTLQCWLPISESLSENQVDILASVASDMAIAIESAQHQRSSLNQVEISQAEQRRIFRRLHDTLGQNISFLRMKLDQYSTMDHLTSISEIQNDIERMRDIANVAYEQIRGTLEDLHPETQSDLSVALRYRGRSVAERSNLKFELIVEGQSVQIPQLVKRHILFICYEALNNIEKHANAQKASIYLRWGEGNVTIIITDDGSGFNPDKHTSEKQFGLNIIRERVEAIDGRLTFDSAPSKGTKITLWVPLSPPSAFGSAD